jgi:two-component system cell cycle response regulator
MAQTRPTIIVADDDRTLLKTLSVILEENGYDVVPVADPRKIQKLMVDVDPDLLILDIMMPKIDGLELLRQIRADRRWRDLPVLMISSMAPEEATVRSLGLGASDFVAKPFRVRELVARVEAQLRSGNVLREARREAKQRATEATVRAEMMDLLHEVTDAFAPDEIYHVLTRRVAHVLNISRCSMVLAKPGDEFGRVAVAAENPMVRNLQVRLDRYPEIRRALESDRPVLVSDVQTDPLYDEVRREWERLGITVATKSVIALPFGLHEQQSGVFFLRTVGDEPALTTQDLEFAEQAVETAVSAIEKAYALQSAESDRARFRLLATIDPLTGCLNRRALEERLTAELDRARRYGLAVSALMVDLDRFKDVNDQYGHLTGDSVLLQVSDLLRREVRSVDVVARYGGEEFLILLPETGLAGALTFADRIRARVAAHEFGKGDEHLTVTVSVGVGSVHPTNDDGVDGDGLIARCDAALYRAKNEGRNLVRS